jgi:L-asparaginase / beta-aspartyl-peptidase
MAISKRKTYAIAIHGGAGLVRRDRYSSEEVLEYEAALKDCLNRGFELLARGASALEAVAEAVRALEDCPLFNAGRGSVLTADEKVQMDASVMCGSTGRSGAVTLVERIRNPVLAARLVMEGTPHRMLGGPEAEALAAAHGLRLEKPDYFVVPRRLEQLRKAKEKNRIELDHSAAKQPEGQDSNTVGAVALDLEGNLAAATSTGGLTNRMSGRVSDSSIIGAGTFARNETLAISGTGMGDIFIQNVLCFDAHALMQYAGLGIEAACERVLAELKRAGGEGGVIALNASGEVCMAFNSEGMFRAFRSAEGDEEVLCFS